MLYYIILHSPCHTQGDLSRWSVVCVVTTRDTIVQNYKTIADHCDSATCYYNIIIILYISGWYGGRNHRNVDRKSEEIWFLVWHIFKLCKSSKTLATFENIGKNNLYVTPVQNIGDDIHQHQIVPSSYLFYVPKVVFSFYF